MSSNIGGGPGGGGLNQGRISIDLKPRDRAHADRSIRSSPQLRPKLAQVPGVRVYMVNQPPINLGGQQGARSLYQFTLQDTDTEELYRWAPILEDKIRDCRASRTSAATCRSRTRRSRSISIATRFRRSA